MAIIYQLANCSKCKKILSETGNRPDLEIVDIKTRAITPAEIDRMADLAGGYEPLFSRRARKYASRGLKDQELTEADYRRLILEEYTFLRRPVTIDGDRIFIGKAAFDD